MALIIKSFTLSKSVEISTRGEKQSEFLSMKFESDVSLTPEQAMIHQLDAHKILEESLVFNCLSSGTITKDIAKDKLSQISERHNGVREALIKKYGEPDINLFINSEIEKVEE